MSNHFMTIEDVNEKLHWRQMQNRCLYYGNVACGLFAVPIQLSHCKDPKERQRLENIEQNHSSNIYFSNNIDLPKGQVLRLYWSRADVHIKAKYFEYLPHSLKAFRLPLKSRVPFVPSAPKPKVRKPKAIKEPKAKTVRRPPPAPKKVQLTPEKEEQQRLARQTQWLKKSAARTAERKRAKELHLIEDLSPLEQRRLFPNELESWRGNGRLVPPVFVQTPLIPILYRVSFEDDLRFSIDKQSALSPADIEKLNHIFRYHFLTYRSKANIINNIEKGNCLKQQWVWSGSGVAHTHDETEDDSEPSDNTTFGNN